MKQWFGLVARLVTGGVWLVAGALKLPEPAESVRAVRAYDLLPEAVVPTVGHLLPVLEVVVGLCLVLGVLTRGMGVVSALLFLAFVVGIASAWARGLEIECGCFGGGGTRGGRVERVPDGDRPGRRPPPAVVLAGGLPADPARPRQPPVPRRTREDPLMSKKNAQDRRSARAAEVIRAQQAAERRRRLVVVGVVAAVVVVAVVIGLLVQSQRDTTGDVATTPEGATDDFGLVVGDADAPHEVVIYEDFLCPICGELEGLTNDGLTEAIEAGRARVEYRPVDFLSRFGDYSLPAANAFWVVLDAAGPDVAKTFHDMLFAEQPSESGPFPEASWFVDKAVEAGADESAVRAGIEDLAFEQWVENATEQASKDGVNATPTVMLDGEPVPGDSLDEIAGNLLEGVS